MEQIKQVMRQMISVTEAELDEFLSGAITKVFKRQETVSRPNTIPNEIFFINK
jgi:tRNA A37 threonylcarbamoyladenosine synthetase subunit TsaC/SUA5/YrdC